MKKVCLFVGMLLLLSPMVGCKKKGTKDTKDKGDPSAMTAADDMAAPGDGAPDGMKPAGDTGLVKVDGVKPEHEKIKWTSPTHCTIMVVTEKVKKELESKKNYQKINIEFSSKTTNEFFKTVANIPWVTDLHLSSYQVEDLSPITKLKNLKYLLVYAPKCADLSLIARSSNLETLSIRFPNPAVKDLSFVKGLKKLRSLSLTGFKGLKDISVLPTLPSLKTLSMDRCNISDIKPLEGAKNLEIVRLEGNPISDISPLAGLSNLEEINIQNTKVKNLSPLKKLKKIIRKHLTLKVSKTIPKKQIKRLKKVFGSKLGVLVD